MAVAIIGTLFHPEIGTLGYVWIGIGLAIGLGAAVATARFIEAFSTGRRPNPEVGITLLA